MTNQLVAFLSGEGPDDQRRMISDIIGWSDHQLETCHDYIQWVFPNRVASRFNPGAPTLDNEVVAAIKSCDAAVANIRQMLFRMYSFYEFEVRQFTDGGYQLKLGDTGRPPRWVRPGNHNFLRLTRILLALREFGLQDELDTLADILDLIGRRYHSIIGDQTFKYWRDISEHQFL